MLTVTFMRGLSASGKSTIARELAKKTGAVRVNMDDLRYMTCRPYSATDEKLALSIQDQVILKALRSGNDVIVDNTHLHAAWPRRVAILLWENNIEVEYRVIDTTAVGVDECVRRNDARKESPTADDSKGVPDGVIEKQARQLQSSIDKGMWTPESITAGLPVIVPVTLNLTPHTPVVLFDIDGTIAEHVDRGPFEMERCHTDAPFHHIAHLAIMYDWAGWTIILCSGREEIWREKTEQWLENHAIPYDHLFMRPEGDQRRDSVIKVELHDAYIRDTFDVQLTYDDRDRVVGVWRALGYPCLQVAPGDF